MKRTIYKHIQIKLVILITVLLCVLPANAAFSDEVDDALDSVVEMDIDGLLDVSIAVASKQDEMISKAPGVVTTLKVEDLKRLGVQTLPQALSLIPGVVVQETHLGTSSLLIRGLSETFNQKVLFLLNGVPFWMSSHGDIPLHGIPFDAIERIEMIRGPGSVIYGTNASAGVINIILKEEAPSHIQVHGGSQELLNSSTFLQHDLGDGDYIVAGAFFQNMGRGYDAYFPETVLVPPFNNSVNSDRESFPTSGSIRKKVDSKGAYLAGKIASTNFLFDYFKSEQNGLGGAPVIFQENDYIQEGLLLHLDHDIKIDPVSLNIFADHNIHFLEINTDNFLASSETVDDSLIVTAEPGKQLYKDPWQENYRFRYGAEARSPLLDQVDLMFGAVHEIRHAGEYRKTNSDKELVALQSNKKKVGEYAVFSNFDIDLHPLRLIIGGRFTDNELAGTNTSPRAALVYSFSDQQSLKFAFSEGFSSPVISQQDLNIPFVVNGNSELEAELTRTYDLAYTYNDSDTLFVVNAYYIDTKDLIERDPDTFTYLNTGNYDRRGVELDFQRALGTDFRVLTNVAYNYEGDDNTISDDPRARFVPEITANAGVYYFFWQNHSIGLMEQFIGRREGIESQSITTANLTLRFDDMEAFVSIYNIFDEDIESPDINNNGRIPVIPTGPGLSAYAGLRYEFSS